HSAEPARRDPQPNPSSPVEPCAAAERSLLLRLCRGLFLAEAELVEAVAQCRAAQAQHLRRCGLVVAASFQRLLDQLPFVCFQVETDFRNSEWMPARNGCFRDGHVQAPIRIAIARL